MPYHMSSLKIRSIHLLLALWRLRTMLSTTRQTVYSKRRTWRSSLGPFTTLVSLSITSPCNDHIERSQEPRCKCRIHRPGSRSPEMRVHVITMDHHGPGASKTINLSQSELPSGCGTLRNGNKSEWDEEDDVGFAFFYLFALGGFRM